ncbi:MAG: hypothetical protein JWQ94_4975, partial [Tardiphaga sp.]|nr:hypothetical protein [Tardiphaga sp.]
NRDFVLRNAQAALQTLSTDSQRRDARDPLLKIDRQEKNEIAAMLKAALERESVATSYLGSSERPPEKRGGESPLTDWAFISSDPVISIVQTALDRHYRRLAGAVTDVQASNNKRRGAGTNIAVTGEVLDGLDAQRNGDRRVFNAFSQTDPRWVASLIAEGIRAFKGKHAFPQEHAAPVEIAHDARLVIVGDWGSGLPRARNMAQNVMRRWIDEAAGRERHVIHLGDIYYSGWPDECTERFLAPWPVKLGEKDAIGSWTLNGNHDMYSGGMGYFGTVLTDKRFFRQGKSSHFALRHPKWEILGLDSAYEDNSLAGDQATWVHDRLADAGGRKGMLLSHHQLFSAYESASPNLGQQLSDTLNAGLIRAWFWGHEHRCAIYKPYMGVETARCVGHGGVPVYQWHGDTDPVADPAAFEFRSAFTTTAGLERWAVFGFVVLDFIADGTIHAYYVDENGNSVYGAARDAVNRAYEVIQ